MVRKLNNPKFSPVREFKKTKSRKHSKVNMSPVSNLAKYLAPRKILALKEALSITGPTSSYHPSHSKRRLAR